MDLITYGILKKKMEGVTEEVTEAKEAAQQAQAKAEQAQAKAKTSETNAKTSETNAAHSATEAAETVENLNTQFQNAMSALTVDSEVQNIRVGEDGTTYPSAGEAVRGQIADLKSHLEDITVVQNLFDIHSIVGGGYFSASGGITANANSYYSTQYIPVTAGTEYKFTAGTTASPYYIATYNANHEFVARQNPSGTAFTPATGVAYIRFSIYNQSFPNDFKFATASDFAHTASEHILLNGQKIYNAPFQSVITQSILADAITKDVLTYGGNYYPGSGGDKTALATQYWYETVARNDFDVWCETDVTYPDIMIAVYNNGTATTANFVARYCKNSSSNTLPTSSNKLSVTTGQLLAISVSNDAAFSFASDGMDTGNVVFNNGVRLNQQQIAQTQDRISVFVGSGNYDIKFGDYNIKFSHITSVSDRADLWNFNGITKGSAVVVGSSTDIIGVLRENGESDFMGGVHGDETNVDFYIFADGSPITGDVICDRIDILMYSHLTRVSTGDNVIDRVAHITITNGVIETEVTFKSLVDNFNAFRVFAGGMWAWYEADKVYATSNIGEIAGSGSSGVDVQTSHDLYTATIITNDYMAFCENIIGRDVEGSYGNAFYYGNEARPRMKMYLGAFKDIVLNSGDFIKGKARYTLL